MGDANIYNVNVGVLGHVDTGKTSLGEGLEIFQSDLGP